VCAVDVLTCALTYWRVHQLAPQIYICHGRRISLFAIAKLNVSTKFCTGYPLVYMFDSYPCMHVCMLLNGFYENYLNSSAFRLSLSYSFRKNFWSSWRRINRQERAREGRGKRESQNQSESDRKKSVQGENGREKRPVKTQVFDPLSLGLHYSLSARNSKSRKPQRNDVNRVTRSGLALIKWTKGLSPRAALSQIFTIHHKCWVSRPLLGLPFRSEEVSWPLVEEQQQRQEQQPRSNPPQYVCM
jgi:hypothetical protein